MIGRGVLWAGLGLGLLLEIVVTVGGRPPLLAGVFSVAAAAGGCGAALLRRRRPATAAVVAAGLVLATELLDAVRLGRFGADRSGVLGAAVAGESVPVLVANGPAPVACLAMLIAAGSAVRRLPLAGAVPAGAAALLPALAARPLYSPTVALVLLCGAVVAIGAGIRLRTADARRRALRESVRRSERTALARDLHDVAAHHLTALIIQAQAGRAGPGDARAALAGIEAAGVEALDSLRRVVRLLRDEERAAQDVPGTVADLVGAFTRRDDPGTVAGELDARLELPDGPQPADWPPDVATGVYRIVQEALTNVIRHARHARRVTVRLAHDARAIRLTVTDDGRAGPSPGAGDDVARAGRADSEPGHGIGGMRERAAALGGTLTAGPDGRGWAVRAVIPLAGARRWR